MGSQYSEHSQGNISSGHFDTNVNNTFFTGHDMLPSPEYVTKDLIIYPQQPSQTQQEGSVFSQIPTSIKQEISLPSYPSELQQCYSNQNEFGMVIMSEEEIRMEKFHSPENSINQNYIAYPPTPTTPHNKNFIFEGFPTPPAEINIFNPELITLSQQAEMFYQRGHYFLHIAKPRDPCLAFSHFATAASLGSQRGKHQFAYCLQHGIGVVRDEKKAVKIYLDIADEDLPNAATLCQLGICFQMGIGVEVDTSRAVQYYERAVHMRHTDAMFNLAYCLRYGLGTPVNYKRAYELYYRLAELGDPQGMKFLGNCMFAGIGTVKDENGALEWFQRSSESDVYWGGKVQYALHLLYGINTVQNHLEAFNLIRTVCENFPLCPGPNKLLLGRLYHFGIGCQMDLEKALYWYERALRSYYMPPYSVRDCEMLINDIHNRQFQFQSMMDVGNGNVIIDEGIGHGNGNC